MSEGHKNDVNSNILYWRKKICDTGETVSLLFSSIWYNELTNKIDSLKHYAHMKLQNQFLRWKYKRFLMLFVTALGMKCVTFAEKKL